MFRECFLTAIQAACWSPCWLTCLSSRCLNTITCPGMASAVCTDACKGHPLFVLRLRWCLSSGHVLPASASPTQPALYHLCRAENMASIEEYRYRHIMPPKEVDWRKSGVVGPIKDQHVNGAPCGCCWAFATTG